MNRYNEKILSFPSKVSNWWEAIRTITNVSSLLNPNSLKNIYAWNTIIKKWSLGGEKDSYFHRMHSDDFHFSNHLWSRLWKNVKNINIKVTKFPTKISPHLHLIFTLNRSLQCFSQLFLVQLSDIWEWMMLNLRYKFQWEKCLNLQFFK